MKQKILFIAAILFISTSWSKENPSHSVYLHPMTLAIGASSDLLPLMLYGTYEGKMKENTSYIITPSYFNWELVGQKLTGYKLGAGYRKYFNERLSGFYVQGKANVGYLNIEYGDPGIGDLLGALGGEAVTVSEDDSGINASGLAYVGVKGLFGNFAIFFDVGAGYQYTAFDASEFSLNGLALDMNLGVGYSF